MKFQITALIIWIFIAVIIIGSLFIKADRNEKLILLLIGILSILILIRNL